MTTRNCLRVGGGGGGGGRPLPFVNGRSRDALHQEGVFEHRGTLIHIHVYMCCRNFRRSLQGATNMHLCEKSGCIRARSEDGFSLQHIAITAIDKGERPTKAKDDKIFCSWIGLLIWVPYLGELLWRTGTTSQAYFSNKERDFSVCTSSA